MRARPNKGYVSNDREHVSPLQSGKGYYFKYIHETNKTLLETSFKAKEKYLPFEATKSFNFNEKFNIHLKELES